MKKYMVKQVLLLALVLAAGCKKDDNNPNSTNYVLTEEFESVYLLQERDWKFVNNNSPDVTAKWTQGNSIFKGTPPGFPATNKNTPDDYAFVNGYYRYLSVPADISSWMITPAVMVKNGDIIRFYTRSSFVPGSINRLQLLLNETSDSYDTGNTPVSVGVFTKILLDINANQLSGIFPAEWTLYSVTLSGLNGPMRTRLAFRYVVSGITASGIGVDEFSITK